MSTYLTLDGGEPQDFASNKGWGDFCRWADSLDAGTFPQVAHLCDHGWSQHLGDLEAQLGRAAADGPPQDEPTRQVAESPLAAVHGRGDAEVLAVTNGVSP